MKENLKKRWIAALRSGEFKQGRYRLFEPAWEDLVLVKNKAGSWCCLGVLAYQMGATHDPEFGTLMYKGKIVESFPNNSEYLIGNYLPANMIKEADIPSEIQSKLGLMNDGGRYNFNAIANWVEKNL